MAPDFPVTELWQALAGSAPGRRSRDEITVFDSVGFAIEDFAALRYVRGLLEAGEHEMDLLPDVGDPKDLFGEVVGAPGLAVGSPPLSKTGEVSRIA
jgi:ornithine cyclodeaminase